jgi:hypothetical protein
MRVLTTFILMLATLGCTHGQTVLRIKIAAHTEVKGMPGMRIRPEEDSTTVRYMEPGRTRFETPAEGPWMGRTMIQRCDTRVLYTIDLANREYREAPIPLPDAQSAYSTGSDRKSNNGPPNLIIDTTTVDTGETKTAFGHAAHRYITTTKMMPSVELGEQPSEKVVDAWYLDIPDVMTCEAGSHRPTGLIGGKVGVGPNGLVGDTSLIEKVRPEFRYSGPDPKGMVLSQKMSTRSVHVFVTGQKEDTELANLSEIVEMSEVSADPALFEVPAGFTKVEKFSH